MTTQETTKPKYRAPETLDELAVFAAYVNSLRKIDYQAITLRNRKPAVSGECKYPWETTAVGDYFPVGLTRGSVRALIYKENLRMETTRRWAYISPLETNPRYHHVYRIR